MEDNSEFLVSCLLRTSLTDLYILKGKSSVNFKEDAGNFVTLKKRFICSKKSTMKIHKSIILAYFLCLITWICIRNAF